MPTVTRDAARPLRRDAELNRQRIMAAADLVFAERGLEATLDDVADRAGLGVGTVYRRFADKQALIDELFISHVNDILAIADQALLRPDPWKSVVFLFEESLALQSAHRGLREIVVNGGVDGARAHVRCALVPTLEKVFARAQKAGVLRDDLQPSDFPYLCLMVGTVADHSRSVEPELWRRYLTVLLDGIRVHSDKPCPLPVAALTDTQAGIALADKPGRRQRPTCV